MKTPLAAFLLAPCLLAQDPYTYSRAGAPNDVTTPTSGGAVLMGGSRDVAAAFAWMIDRSGRGDFLVLRAAGTDAYNPFVLEQGPAHSAATLIIRSRAAASHPFVLEKVRHAEAIFLAGGDQWNYIRLWKDTPLARAIQQRIDAGVPIGGTSAGLAVLGQYYFSAEFDTITSAEAEADPAGPKIALGRDFLRVPHLEDLITDSHFSERKRQGRLAIFLRRLGGDQITGLGIDERTAVLLSPDGSARVVGAGGAHLFRNGHPPRSYPPGAALSLRKPRE
jgi:cyanophycinase